MFNYDEIPADIDIQKYLRKFWILNNIANSFATEQKYALPNGCFTMAFVTGNGITLQYEKHTLQIPEGIYFFGQITTRVKIIVKSHTKAIMAQLSPWVAPLITNLPLNELTNNFIALGSINKGLSKPFGNINYANEQVLIPEFYKAVENLSVTHNFNFIKNTFHLFENKAFITPLKLSDLASQSGYSQRYIEKKFKAHIGLSPGEYYALLRLRNLIDEMDNSTNSPALGFLAHKYGYFDQSHFIKSYSKVMNSLPKKFNSQDYILPFNN